MPTEEEPASWIGKLIASIVAALAPLVPGWFKREPVPEPKQGEPPNWADIEAKEDAEIEKRRAEEAKSGGPKA